MSARGRLTRTEVGIVLVILATIGSCGLANLGLVWVVQSIVSLLFGWVSALPGAVSWLDRHRVLVGASALAVAGVTVVLHGAMRRSRSGWTARRSLSAGALVGVTLAASFAAASLLVRVTGLGDERPPSETFVTAGAIWNEVHGLGNLKRIAQAQAVFKARDGLHDYGTLDELGRARLVDELLGTGTKQGYVFQVGPSVVTPEFLWFAVAVPSRRWDDRQRTFFTNHSGAIFHTTTATPFAIDRVTCEPPAGFVPVGQ